MNITQKQKEILSFINDNEKEIKELLNMASIKEVKNIGDTIEVAGITWRKFAEDEQGNHLMIADDVICKSKFGTDNNWKNSIIRTEILQDLYTKIVQEIGANNMVLFETDLFSHDGLRDYGKIEERISILTYDIYRNNRENIKQIDKSYWLATPDSTPSGYGSDYVQCVDSGGDVSCDWCGCVRGVRPFFILRA